MKKILLLSVAFVFVTAPLMLAQVDPFKSDPLPEGFDPFDPEGKKQAKKAPAKEFKVSQANSTPANKKLFLELWQALTKPSLTEKSVKMTFTITQAVGKEAGGMHRYLCGDQAVILKDGDLLEDASVTAWVNPAGVYDFTTVLGATRRVALYKEAVAIADENAPTQEEFVAMLKNGQTFKVLTINSKGCPKCFGDGELGAMSKNAPCQDCGGSGEAVVNWLLKW